MTESKFHLHTAREDFIFDSVDANLKVTGTIVSEQHISQDFLDKMKRKREAQDRKTFAEITKGDDIEKIHLCRIPVAVVNKWAREGFDMMTLIDSGDPKAAQTILAKLRLEDMTAFQLTSKNF